GICDLELIEQRDVGSVLITLIAEADVSAIPTVRQHHTRGVLSGAKVVGDIVYLVLKAVVIARPPRCQHGIANALSVKMCLIQSMGSHVQPRGAVGFTYLKSFPHQRNSTLLRFGIV